MGACERLGGLWLPPVPSSRAHPGPSSQLVGRWATYPVWTYRTSLLCPFICQHLWDVSSLALLGIRPPGAPMRRKNSQSQNIKGSKLPSKGLSTRAQVSLGLGAAWIRGEAPPCGAPACLREGGRDGMLPMLPPASDAQGGRQGIAPLPGPRARPAPSTASAKEGQPQGRARDQPRLRTPSTFPRPLSKRGSGLFSRSGGFGTGQACGDLLKPQILPTQRPCCAERWAPPWAQGLWAPGMAPLAHTQCF